MQKLVLEGLSWQRARADTTHSKINQNSSLEKPLKGQKIDMTVHLAAVRSDGAQRAMQILMVHCDGLPSDGQDLGSQEGLFGSCSGRASRQ